MNADDHAAEDPQLEQAVLQYLESVDQGRPVDRHSLLKRYLEVASDLAAWFRVADELERSGRSIAVSTVDILQAKPGAATEEYHSETLKSLFDTRTVLNDLSPEFDRLQLIRCGGMGIVYRARQRTLNRDVALKFVLMGGAASKEEQQRFQVEAEALALLRHPGIVTVHGVHRAGGQTCLVMEYVDGTNLKDLIQETPLAPERAAATVQTVAEAVEEAHRQGILHRDLKPANILIDQQGRPQVTDFGLARIAGDRTEITVTGQILGTPGYMSPEQATGARDVDCRTDVYAMGAILYAALAGRPPFRADTVAGTLQLVRMHDVPPLKDLVPNVPHDLETICLKCLQKSRQQRYQSAQELADDLHRFLNNEVILAQRASVVERSIRWFARNPVIGTAALLVALLAGALVTGLGWHTATVRNLNRNLTHRNQELDNSLTVVQELREQEKQLREQEQTSLLRARRLQYASDMSRAGDALLRQDARQLTMLLDAQRAPPSQPDIRGFAWHFLNCGLPRPVWENTVTSSACYCLALAPDGSNCLAAGADAQIRVLDMDAGACQRQWDTEQVEVNGLSFHPDGTMLASSGDDGTVCIWSWPDGVLLNRLTAINDGRVYAVEFSQNKKHLFAAGESSDIYVWDLQAEKWLDPLPTTEQKGSIQRLVSGNGGRWLLSAGPHRSAYLWNAEKGWVSIVLPNYSSGSVAAGLFPDRRRTVTGGGNGGLNVFHVRSRKSLEISRPDGIRAIEIAQDNTMAVSDRGGTVSLWAPEVRLGTTREPHCVWQVDNDHVAMCFADGSQSLLTGSDSGRVALWRTGVTGNVVSVTSDESAVKPFPGLLTAEADGHFLLINDGELTKFDPAANRGRRLTAVGNRPQVSDIEIRTGAVRLGNGTLILQDDNARISVHRNGKQVDRFTLKEFPKGIHTHVLMFDRQSILTGADGPLFLVDLTHRTTTQVSDRAARSACSPRSPWIWIAESGTNDLVALDKRSFDIQMRCPAHRAGVNAIVISPDGNRIASGGDDRQLTVWNTTTGERCWAIDTLSAEPSHMAWSPDLLTLAVGFYDGSVRLYQTETGREVLQLKDGDEQSNASQVCFSNDGTWLAVVRTATSVTAYRATRH